jgi:hypothetical protein
MPDPVVTDLRRELEKARHTLLGAQSHLASHAEMNAALHCATTVMYSPLHAAVTATIGQIEHALARTESEPQPPVDHTDSELVRVLGDLDRCEHGRHSVDHCYGCPDGQSAGNPFLPVGQQIGYGLHGGTIVVPAPEDRRRPEAWRVKPNTATGGPR